MTPERWKQIEECCEEALAYPPTERAAFLDQACAGDPDLRRLVEGMMAAEQEDEEAFILDAPLGTYLDLPPEPPLPEGEHVGPYRLVKPLGRGGMGTVYLAVRDDGAFEQQVALKIVRRGLDTDDILRRFRTERQILAGLNHDYIARLLDGGATEDGHPYLDGVRRG